MLQRKLQENQNILKRSYFFLCNNSDYEKPTFLWAFNVLLNCILNPLPLFEIGGTLFFGNHLSFFFIPIISVSSLSRDVFLKALLILLSYKKAVFIFLFYISKRR